MDDEQSEPTDSYIVQQYYSLDIPDLQNTYVTYVLSYYYIVLPALHLYWYGQPGHFNNSQHQIIA